LAVVVASLGLVVPNGAAVALEDLARVAGSASAVLGLSQYAFGAAAAPIIGIAGAGSIAALAVTLLLLGMVGVSAALLARRGVEP
jgi:DHA1 family bicyclomycin/chloramphenicol resistance-like MFS transporter